MSVTRQARVLPRISIAGKNVQSFVTTDRLLIAIAAAVYKRQSAGSRSEYSLVLGDIVPHEFDKAFERLGPIVAANYEGRIDIQRFQ
jgi:hypothetical protein